MFVSSLGGVVIVYERKVKLLFGKFRIHLILNFHCPLLETDESFFPFCGVYPSDDVNRLLVIRSSFIFCFPVKIISPYLGFWVLTCVYYSQVEINGAWRTKVVPDPTLLPKGRTHARYCYYFHIFFLSLLLSYS